MAIPSLLLPTPVKVGADNWTVQWMGTVIAKCQSQGKARTIARAWRPWLNRLGLATSIDSAALGQSLLQFLATAPAVTEPPFPSL